MNYLDIFILCGSGKLWFGFDNSMTHKAKAPDGLDASKLNKSDAGANVPKMRDGHNDSVVDGVTTRVIQKVQNPEGVQLGLLSILRARGKACLKLPDGQYSGNELNKLCNNCKNQNEKENRLLHVWCFIERAGLQGAKVVAIRDS